MPPGSVDPKPTPTAVLSFGMLWNAGRTKCVGIGTREPPIVRPELVRSFHQRDS